MQCTFLCAVSSKQIYSVQIVDLLYPQWLSSLEPQSLFLHVPRRWADGARGARVRGIVALGTGLDSGGGLFEVGRGRRAGAGAGTNAGSLTPSTLCSERTLS